jgi:hypothetical protein
MKKRDFIGELLSYGTGFAMSFLIIIGLSIATIVFLIAVMFVSFLERVMN